MGPALRVRAMSAGRRQRFRRLATLGFAISGVILGIGALLLLARYAPSLADFGRRHVLILAVNALAAVALAGVILVNLVRLVRDYRRKAPGARLRARLVAMFVGLTLAPLLIVYFFAIQFVNGGIDSWFDSDLEQELSSALRLSRETLEVQATSRLSQTRALASALGTLDGEALSRALGVLRADANADELAVFTADRRIAAASSRTASLPPVLPDDAVDELVRTQRFVVLEPQGGARYQVRTAVPIPGDLPEGSAPVRYLQAVYPVGYRQGRLADAVQDTYSRYSELRFLRQPLQDNLTLTLSLVLLLSLLSAATGAFYLARRLAAPIESLAAGTEAVAKGDFDTRLAPGAADEVGFLIQSFNGMIERLARAREESRVSQQQLERERANLATILGNLSTGVIATGADGRIRIANDAAGEILGVDLATRTGSTLAELAAAGPLAAQFVDACRGHLSGEHPDWRGQIALRTEAAPRILNCASSALPGDGGDGTATAGAIVVFDDVTDLLVAQREAAWGEVARRLAHEIKNPLTPIRLAAERIRRRYLPSMDEEDSQVLDRSTHTIVQQVEAMRDMVNAFSEYARAPAVNIARVDLAQLVREVAWLYRAQEGPPAVTLSLDEGLEVDADAVRVRQLLHNLIRNAQDALEGQADGAIEIAARLVPGGERPMAEITVSDNGPGIAPDVITRLFEPYVTSKKKGTGLGLAIVKKLVEEHGGVVAAENLPAGGARLSVRLPVRAAARDVLGEARPVRAEPWREKA
ncbi:MAG: HAMP domain-containing protein [Gammaproteobacteria bacterium]|nr:HAMP domain-containing protein [Gammaproteobacteria bacterium]